MSAAEVEAHLRKKGVASAEVAAVVKRLTGFGYVDDARYASDYIATRGRSRALGPARLRSELARRGISRKIVDSALARAREEGSVPIDDASRALEKLLRGKKAPVDRKGRDRLRAALARRGFGGAAIARAMLDLRSRGGARDEADAVNEMEEPDDREEDQT